MITLSMMELAARLANEGHARGIPQKLFRGFRDIGEDRVTGDTIITIAWDDRDQREDEGDEQGQIIGLSGGLSAILPGGLAGRSPSREKTVEAVGGTLSIAIGSEGIDSVLFRGAEEPHEGNEAMRQFALELISRFPAP